MKISTDNKCLFLMMVIITMMVKVNLITYWGISELLNCVWCRQFVLQSFRESFSKLEGFISHREQRETNLRSLLPSRNCIRLRLGQSTDLRRHPEKKLARAESTKRLLNTELDKIITINWKNVKWTLTVIKLGLWWKVTAKCQSQKINHQK